MPVSRETLTVAATSEQLSRLKPLAAWLGPRAAALGLTTFAQPSDFLINIMLPALSSLGWAHFPPPRTIAELGPGSGGLGLALALLLQDAQVVLVDRRERVTAFLDLAIRATGLTNATTELRDISRHAPADPWDVVVFRALAEPRRALHLAARCAGRLVCAIHAPTAPYDGVFPGLTGLRDVVIEGCPVQATLYAVNPRTSEGSRDG